MIDANVISDTPRRLLVRGPLSRHRVARQVGNGHVQVNAVLPLDPNPDPNRGGRRRVETSIATPTRSPSARASAQYRSCRERCSNARLIFDDDDGDY